MEKEMAVELLFLFFNCLFSLYFLLFLQLMLKRCITLCYNNYGFCSKTRYLHKFTYTILHATYIL